MKIWKCENVEMIATHKCCVNFHIFQFSHFHIFE